MNSRLVGACKTRSPAQGKNGLVDISKLVGVEENEADISESARVDRDIGGLEIRHKVGVCVQPLVEGKFLTGVFLYGIATDFEWWPLPSRWIVANQGLDLAPVS